METKRDYYEVLGVNREAEEGAIKKAYRKLAKNIIRIRMQEMLRQSRDLKRLQKHIRF